jgi:hypothetical protein
MSHAILGVVMFILGVIVYRLMFTSVICSIY